MKPLPGEIGCFDLGRREPAGHEQAGRRPCIVVSDPAGKPPLRFPLVSVVSLTTASLPDHPLYPVLPTGAGGLSGDSTVLVDQPCAVDMRRTLRRVGRLSPAGLAPVLVGLRHLLSL